MSVREKKIEKEIKDYLFQKRVYHIKIHADSFMVPGIPDIICCYNGRFIGIEVKRPNNKKGQSDAQKIHEENIVKSGGIYILADSLNDVKEIINE